MLTVNAYRYQLPKKAIKGPCPQCGGPRHRKTLSRYVDMRTSEPLPPEYGRCDRESNCGYHLNPYHPEASGMSYADRKRSAYQPIPKAWFKLGWRLRSNGVSHHDCIQELMVNKGATLEQAQRVATYSYEGDGRATPVFSSPPTERGVYSIPDALFHQSLAHYERNAFARLLRQYFGADKADTLLHQFRIGTSSRWPGACIFWYIDEQDRKRGGQIKLFDQTFHTDKYVDRQGGKHSKISWVHASLLRGYRAKQRPVPAWLTEYDDHAERSPCLFGLPQLAGSPLEQPVALVEAPKTAVLCTLYFPQLIWLAVGSLSYLNAQRLAPLRNRAVLLFPDLSPGSSAFAHWSRVAQGLNEQGFAITVSDYLEQQATTPQRNAGFDLADYLLDQWPGYPPSWDW